MLIFGEIRQNQAKSTVSGRFDVATVLPADYTTPAVQSRLWQLMHQLNKRLPHSAVSVTTQLITFTVTLAQISILFSFDV